MKIVHTAAETFLLYCQALQYPEDDTPQYMETSSTAAAIYSPALMASPPLAEPIGFHT